MITTNIYISVIIQEGCISVHERHSPRDEVSRKVVEWKVERFDWSRNDIWSRPAFERGMLGAENACMHCYHA